MRSRLSSCTILFFVLVGCSGSNPPPPPGNVIGAAGGSVSSADGKVTLDIPAGALSSDVRIDIEPNTSLADPGLVPGTAYDLTPDGTEFAKPVAATFRYDPAKLPSGGNESQVRLFKFLSNGQRLADPSTVDTSAHAVHAQLSGFSGHGLICCSPPVTPQGFAATWDAANDHVHLAWGAVSASDSGLAIERASQPNPTASDYQPLTSLARTVTVYDDPGSSFQPGMVIWYRLFGVAGSLRDAPAVVSVRVPGSGPTLSLSAVAAGPSQINLSWNDVGGVTGYSLARRTGSAAYSEIARPTAGALTYSDTGLTAATQYDYQLTASLSGGSTAIATARATTAGQGGGGQQIYASGYVVNGSTTTGFIARMDDIHGNGWKSLRGNSAGTDHFNSPWGIAVDGSGNIYVADRTRVVRTDINGFSWQVLSGNAAGTDHFSGLEGIALDGAGNIYVTDWSSPTIARVIMTDFAGSTWTVLGGAPGNGQSQFAVPGQITTDSQYIYVADRGNARIVQTKISGSPWNVLAHNQQGTDHFVTPRGVALDPSGKLIIADEQGHRLVQADMSGAFWQAIALPPQGHGDANPSYVASAADGTIYVASYFSNYLVEVKTDGSTLSFTAAPDGSTFSQVYGVAVGP